MSLYSPPAPGDHTGDQEGRWLAMITVQSLLVDVSEIQGVAEMQSSSHAGRQSNSHLSIKNNSLDYRIHYISMLSE